MRNLLKAVPLLVKIHRRLDLFLYTNGIYRTLRLSLYRKRPAGVGMGYEIYRWEEIDKALGRPCLPAVAFGKGVDKRIVEYPWVIQNLPSSGATILDAGSTLNFPQVLGKLKGNRIFITTLYPENRCLYKDRISYTYEDLRSLSFRDDYFDFICCLSTLEHIGFDNEGYRGNLRKADLTEGSYMDAVLELKRVLKPDGVLLISVPFGKHQRRDSFQNFNYQMVQNVINKFNPKSYSLEVFKYTGDGWIEADPQECGDFGYSFPEERPAADGATGARAVALVRLVRTAKEVL